ncbi:MAG: hypothetical protein JXR05_16815 [Flavobacteriaceae bacterium]
MESYLLKSSVCLIVLYIVYKSIFKSDAHHQLKRYVSLLCIVFACSFVFIPLGSLLVPDTYPELLNIVFMQGSEGIQDGLSKVIPENSGNIYLTIYFIGILFFGLRSLLGLGTLIRWYVISKKSKKWGFTVIKVNKKVAPFTFFKTLFIGSEKLDEEAIKALIVHEQYHRDQWHSIDTVVLEILTIVYWFNPVAWLFRKDIKTEHEFMADAQVLKKGFDTMNYQYLLFQTRTGASLQLGSNFSSKTSLKKRFKMMNKEKIKTKRSYVRAFMFFPIMGLILVFSAFLEANNNLSEEIFLLKQNVNSKVDTIPTKKEWEKDKEPKFTMTGKDSKAKVVVEWVKDSKWVKDKKANKQPLFILIEGGKEKIIFSSDMEKIVLENIESVQVIKDKAATQKYGEKGKYGVVVIKMKRK